DGAEAVAWLVHDQPWFLGMVPVGVDQRVDRGDDLVLCRTRLVGDLPEVDGQRTGVNSPLAPGAQDLIDAQRQVVILRVPVPPALIAQILEQVHGHRDPWISRLPYLWPGF